MDYIEIYKKSINSLRKKTQNLKKTKYYLFQEKNAYNKEKEK